VSDRLALSNAIEDALVSIAGHGTVAVETSIVRAKAERIASTIVDLIHDNVATKADVSELRGEIRRVETSLRGDLALIEHRLLTRLGGLVVVVGGAVVAALHYWPPSVHG
jgi:hypothetical protein